MALIPINRSNASERRERRASLVNAVCYAQSRLAACRFMPPSEVEETEACFIVNDRAMLTAMRRDSKSQKRSE